MKAFVPCSVTVQSPASHRAVFKADRLCVSLNSRLESNTEEEEEEKDVLVDRRVAASVCVRVSGLGFRVDGFRFRV